MRFADARPRRRAVPDALSVPLVGVVFLLLLFFLLSAGLPPHPPGPLDLPAGPGPVDAGGGAVLFLDAEGGLAFGALRGPAVFRALPAGRAVEIRADRGVSASALAHVLARLAEAGIAEARLVTVTP